MWNNYVANEKVEGCYRKCYTVTQQWPEICIIYPQCFIIIISSCMKVNRIMLHVVDTVFSFPLPFGRFWERHRLNSIWVWEFPEYLWLSLPSGLHCMMSYLMQPDKQYACTDSIKGNEWGTHMGGLYVHLHTSTHRLWNFRLYHF